MAIEGPLKELNIHDVFQLLDLGRKTGVLCVTSELRQNGGMVCFERGAVVAAEIRSNPHPLGTLLLRAGKISEADLARARAMQASGDTRRLGDILVENDGIGRKELERLVRQQVEEVIFELMSWSEGYFSFEDSTAARASAEASVRIPTEALLMEAARRIDEWSRIEKRVPHVGVIPRLNDPGSQPPHLDLAPLEWEVLAGVDGARDLRSIADTLGRSEFEVARTIFGLVTTSVVSLEDPRRTASAAPKQDAVQLIARAEEQYALGDYESARVAAADAVAAQPERAAAHLALARAYLALQVPEAAEEALSEALRLDASLPAARRLLGLALAAQGRFGEAAAAWIEWERLAARPLEEEMLTRSVQEWTEAAKALALAIRVRRD